MLTGAFLSTLAALVVRVDPGTLTEHREVLLSSCSRALADQTCVLLPDSAANFQPDAQIRKLGEDHYEVILKLPDSTKDREPPSESESQGGVLRRQVTFQPGDLPIEKARSLGLSVGILAREARLSAETEDMAPDPENTGDEARKASLTNDKIPLLLGVGTGVEWEPGLGRAAVAGEIYAQIHPWQHYGFSGSLSVSMAPGPSEAPNIRFLAPTLGVSRAFWAPQGPSLVLTLEGGAEQVSARLSQTQAAEGARQSTRWIGAALATAKVLFPLSPGWVAHVSPHAKLNFSTTEVLVDDTLIGTTSLLRIGVTVGVSWIR